MIDLDTVRAALRHSEHAGFGDGTGRWASVRDVAIELEARGRVDLGDVWYGRVRRWLEDLAAQGRVRRHPAGADFWQHLPPSSVPLDPLNDPEIQREIATADDYWQKGLWRR